MTPSRFFGGSARFTRRRRRPKMKSNNHVGEDLLSQSGLICFVGVGGEATASSRWLPEEVAPARAGCRFCMHAGIGGEGTLQKKTECEYERSEPMEKLSLFATFYVGMKRNGAILSTRERSKG